MTNWLEEQEEIKERINIQRNRNEYRSSDFWSLEHKAIDAEHTARSMLKWIQELDGYEIYIERQEFIDKELKRERENIRKFNNPSEITLRQLKEEGEQEPDYLEVDESIEEGSIEATQDPLEAIKEKPKEKTRKKKENHKKQESEEVDSEEEIGSNRSMKRKSRKKEMARSKDKLKNKHMLELAMQAQRRQIESE